MHVEMFFYMELYVGHLLELKGTAEKTYASSSSNMNASNHSSIWNYQDNPEAMTTHL